MNTEPNLTLPKAASPAMFNAIAGRYDFLNRLLSLGQDLRWRRELKKYLPQHLDLTILDLATGTADVVITLVEGNPNIHMAYGVDMAEKMLDIGRQKIEAKKLHHKIQLQKADAQSLPFLNDTFDAVSIAFGIRNIPDLRLALLEMCRVTKKGGRIMILEFSMPENIFLRIGHIFYLRCIVPVVGFIFSGHYKPYRYLNQTIESFPYGDRFCKILKQFGFLQIQSHPLMGGTATIYVAEKK